jgi:LysM repeat protein
MPRAPINQKTGNPMRRTAVVIFLLCLVAVVALAMPVFGQGNLLVDGGMEGTYTNRGRPDFNVPEAWGVWFAESPRTQSWMNLQPVAFPHNGPGPNPYEGSKSFNFNKGYATYTAAIFQQVSVPQGSPVSASATAQIKTCNVGQGQTTCGSAVESGAYTRIGIDPNGGTNPYDSDVVWSSNAFPHDRWDTMTVSATSTGPTVTLFLFTTQQWPAQLNNAYWDAASLTVGGPGGAAQPGQPAATLVPTAPPVASFVTRQPAQADGSIVHTVQPGDTLDAIAFAYSVPRATLLELNGLTAGSARFLMVGQQIRVRGPQQAEAQPTAATTQGDPNVSAQMAATASAIQANPAAQPTAAGLNPLSSLRIQPDGSVMWMVQPGQTADVIANANGITVEELLTLNGLQSADQISGMTELMIFPAPGSSLSAPVDMPAATPAPSGLTPDTAPPAPIVSITSVLPAMDVADAPAQVCVSMFEDANQNRLQEVGEALLAGGAVMVMRGTEMVDDYTTTGADEPHCFSDLGEGDFLISAFSPTGYGLTTPPSLLVRPAPGWTISISFGAAEGFVPPAASASADTAAAQVVSAAPESAAGKVQTRAKAGGLDGSLSYIAFGMAGAIALIGTGVSLALRLR